MRRVPDGGTRDQSAPLPLPVAVPLAVAAGLALLVAFPPYGWWPLAPVGVALLAAAAHRRRLRAGAGLGFLDRGGVVRPAAGVDEPAHRLLPWVLLSLLQAGYLALLGAGAAVGVAAGRPVAVGVAGW